MGSSFAVRSEVEGSGDGSNYHTAVFSSRINCSAVASCFGIHPPCSAPPCWLLLSLLVDHPRKLLPMSTPLAHHWDGPSASKRDCHSDQTSSDSTDDEEDFRDLVPLRKFKEHQESLQTAQIKSHTTHTVTLNQHEPGSVAKPLALKRATGNHVQQWLACGTGIHPLA